jgi:HEAT repeat protein
MSLFGSMFGPNIDALKKKKDHEGLWNLRHHKTWELKRDALIALADIGDERAVQYLLASTQPGEDELSMALLQAVARDPKMATATVRIAQAGGYSYAADRVFLVLETYHNKILPELLVEDLINSREGPFWWKRHQLRRMLLPFAPRVVKHLIELLEDPHHARKAAPLVGVMGRAAGAAAKPLIDAFHDNPALKSEVHTALLEIYDSGLDALLAALNDPDENVRALATRVLALMPQYVRHREGETQINVEEEKVIRERIRQANAEALDRALTDASELVRKASHV